MSLGRLSSLALALTLALGCGGGPESDGDGDSDADACADGGSGVDLRCPVSVDLGCVPGSGAPGGFEVTARGCDGEPAEIVCDPPPEATFLPGSTTAHCTATIDSGAQASCDVSVEARHEGSFDLGCEGRLEVECAGPATPVEVPAPGVVGGCGTLVGALGSDAPEGGFPRGETLVTFVGSGSAGFEATCTTTVAVIDTAPPTIVCPDSSVAVRTAPGLDAPAPALSAADDCEGAVAATASPATLARGTYPVAYRAVDGAGLAAECSTSVTVLDTFAVSGLRIVGARLSGGATSVSLAWEPSTGADATGYRIERADSDGGPFTALGSVGVETLTYTDPTLPGSEAHYRVVTLAGDYDGGATAPLRALALAAELYDIRDQRVPGIAFSTTLYGVVRRPADLSGGPFPLVVFLHGNHGNCRPSPFTSDDECAETADHDCPWPGYTTTPNAEGYVYLQETLAAQGFVAVSLSGNAVNCRDDFIMERASLIVEHLRRWASWTTGGEGPFGATYVGAVDMSRVGLVGHSRGGDAVSQAPALLRSSPVAGVAVGAVFAIAPTDFHEADPGAVPYAVLLPSCDGDVYTLAGMGIYDRALDPEVAEPRDQVFFIGANHNFFSTEWRYDDNDSPWGVCATRDEVGAAAQQGMLAPVLSAWFNGTLRPGAELEPFLRADADTPAGIDAWAGRGLDLRWSHSAAGRVMVDDFAGPDAPSTNRLGYPNRFDGYATAERCSGGGCLGGFQHEIWVVRLRWDGGTPLATIDLGGVDASASPYLSMRVASRNSDLNAGLTEQDLVIRVVDGDGTSVELLLSEVQRIPHLYPSRLVREVLQTVRVPLSELPALDPTFDPATLDRVELEMTAAGHTRGSIIVSDLDLAP